MSEPLDIESAFRAHVGSQVELVPRGKHDFIVSTPFTFDDGDEYALVLRRTNNRWYLSDEGHTFMHLSYDIDEKDWQTGTRDQIVRRVLESYELELRDGEIVTQVEGEAFGPTLFTFLQAITRLADIRYLSREQVKSTFFEDLSAVIEQVVPPGRYTKDWTLVEKDPHGYYKADYRLNGHPERKPLLVYAISNNVKAHHAVISLLTFKEWGLKFDSVSVLEDAEGLHKRELYQVMDASDKVWSNFRGNVEKIRQQLNEYVEE